MIEFKQYIHHAADLEFAVLGACMLEKSAIGRIYGIVKPDDFYVTDNQKVYAAMSEMFDKNIPIDMLTVAHWLTNKAEKFDAGAIPWYLCRLTNIVCNAAHIEYHSHIIKEMWRKRELMKLTMSGIDEMDDPQQQAYEINGQINDIIGSEIKQDWYSMDQLMFGLMKHQEQLKQGKGNVLTTGFKAIDRLNGGFWGGQFIVMGARPSMGKSALMGGMAVKVAKAGKKVGIISLEMNNNEIAARLASLETDFDFQTIFRNLFEDEGQHRRFYDVISKQTINLPIYVSDKTRVDINEIRAKAIKLKHKIGCDFIIVDYLQLISSDETKRNINREQEVSRISRGLKLMAIELDIPVMALCQLNREVEKRGQKDRYPKESDLRESGSLEQDADVIIMLHRDWKAGYETDENGNSTEFNADLLGLKWRNGATFKLELDFAPTRMRFTERSTGNWRPVNTTPYNEPKEKDEDTPF